MSEPAFTVIVQEALPDGRFVVTNSSNADIPNGTFFVQVVAEHGTLSDEGSYRVTHREPCVSVLLRLTSIEFFHRSVDSIPKGHHAGVQFAGEDAALLRGLVERYRRPWQVLLQSPSTPGEVAN